MQIYSLIPTYKSILLGENSKIKHLSLWWSNATILTRIKTSENSNEDFIIYVSQENTEQNKWREKDKTHEERAKLVVGGCCLNYATVGSPDLLLKAPLENEWRMVVSFYNNI